MPKRKKQQLNPKKIRTHFMQDGEQRFTVPATDSCGRSFLKLVGIVKGDEITYEHPDINFG